MTLPLYRSLEFERGVTQQAARGAVDPSRLISHAEQRINAASASYTRDPMQVAPGRDLMRDVREELADARNYALWAMQQNLEDEDFCHEALIGLRFIALAYERFSRDE